MSAAVLPFKPRLAETPHLQGVAVCVACGHEWHAAIPVCGAVNSMECEGCGAMKGVYSTPTVACASCGELRNAIDLFNH